MDFVRALALTALRIIGIFLVFLGLNALLTPNANAQDVCTQNARVVAACPPTANPPCDQGEAYHVCMSAAKALVAAWGPPFTPRCDQSGSSYGAKAVDPVNGPSTCQTSASITYFNSRTCLSRNSDFMNDPELLNWAGQAPTCVGGCAVQYSGVTTNSLFGQIAVMQATDRFYTGEVCELGQPAKGSDAAEPKKTDSCKPAGDGQTFCIKPNGQHCHTTSNGKTFCWTANEMGTKTDGIDAQIRSLNGQQPPPIQKPNDQGEWIPNNGHAVTVTNNNTTTTITVTNFSSGSSKPNKPVTNPDITDGEESDGEGGSATPATNCAETPACSGGDAIGCAMLRQHHSMICMEGSTTPNGVPEGDPESSVTEPVNSLFTGDEGSDGPGLDLIDMDGWAGRGACPIALTITNPFGGSFQMDESHLCMILDALAGLVSLLAGIHGGWILLGGSRR